MGRKQPVEVLLVALRQLSDQGRIGSQLFRYPYGSVAAIQRKIVAAICKIWRAQPGAAVAFVASISESHKKRVQDARESLQKPGVLLKMSIVVGACLIMGLGLLDPLFKLMGLPPH